jgi:hypothetical protein
MPSSKLRATRRLYLQNNDAKKTASAWTPLSRLRDVVQLTADDDWSQLTVPGMPSDHTVYNPSIIVDPTDQNQFLVLLRTANYKISDDWRYGNHPIKTINYLAKIPTMNQQKWLNNRRADAEAVKESSSSSSSTSSITSSSSNSNSSKTTNTQSSYWTYLGPLKTPPMPYPNSHISGWEDVRLQIAPDHKTVMASFTSLEITPQYMPAISWTTIDVQKQTGQSPVRLHGLRSTHEKEKNWMSFVFKENVYFVYMMNPLIILKANTTTGETSIVQKNNVNPNLPTGWSGSSPLLKLPTELVKMLPSKLFKLFKLSTSEKEKEKEKEKEETEDEQWFISLAHIAKFPYYSSFFVVFKLTTNVKDDNFRMEITHYSNEFVFEKHEIEYALSLALTPDSTEFVLPYSRRDRDCHCARFKPSSLLPGLLCVSV